MEAIAQYDFDALESNELAFKKGNLLKVFNIEDDTNWFLAELKGKEGLIPSNYIKMKSHDWYYGKITRADSEQLLAQYPVGCFLVRKSESSSGDFSLSVKCDVRVQHFKVLRDEQSKFFLWVMKFGSLNELVDYHRKSSVYRSQDVKLRDMPTSIPYRLNQNPMLVVGLYDFIPQEDGELAFNKGDEIFVINCSDSNWWRGMIGSREGLFPASYVTPYNFR